MPILRGYIGLERAKSHKETIYDIKNVELLSISIYIPPMQKPLSTNFYQLSPDAILNCVEKNGFIPTGEIQQLNSYENRVFNIKLEPSALYPVTELIAKFYRPQRWSKETLLDEHAFEAELKQEGLAVATAHTLKNGTTVDEFDGIYFTFFEKIRGRMLDELMPAHFKKMGRWLGQLHNIAERAPAQYRPTLGPSNDHKWEVLDQLYDHVSPEVRAEYFDAAETIFSRLDELLQDTKLIRTHGDLHRGNILESPLEGFVVVDFDDFVNGPSIQDVWMLMPDTDFQDSDEFQEFVSGYEELRHFPYNELPLIPLLRGYRIINYAAWILNRWSDPSFPKIFPEFNTYKYWAEETESLARIARSLDL
jgi:Ser/Thr protein kinase RdoA (MazF antagonist)